MAKWSKAIDSSSIGQLSAWVQIPFCAFNDYRRSCLAGFSVAAKPFHLRFRQSQYTHEIENQTGYRMVLFSRRCELFEAIYERRSIYSLIFTCTSCKRACESACMPHGPILLYA